MWTRKEHRRRWLKDRHHTFEHGTREFLRNSTIHGLKYIEQSDRHLIERICWILFVLLGLSVSAYLCWLEWKEWDESPLLVTLDPTLATHETLPFPSVTICSTNKVSKKRLAAVMQTQRFRNVSYDSMIRSLHYMSKVDDLIDDSEAFLNLSRQLKAADIDSETLAQILKQVSPRCTDLIIDCIWMSSPVDCGSIFSTEPTDDGRCCTFNGPFSNPVDQFVHDYGLHAGLRLILLTDTDDFAVTTSRFDGFRVLLHHDNDYPDIRKRGFVTGPGVETFVAVNRISIHSTTSVAQLPFEKRFCYFPDEGRLRYFRNYSTSACFSDCRYTIIADQCGCEPHFFPGNDYSVRNCSLEDYLCVAKVITNVRSARNQCHCPASCNDHWFTAEITSASFPTMKFASTKTFGRIQSKIQTLTADQYSKRLSGLSIYFKYNAGDQYKMDVHFRWVDFVAMVGGLLGLGLGFSFISAVELCYFIFCRCCCSGRKKIADQRPWPVKQGNEHPIQIYHIQPNLKKSFYLKSGQ